MTWLRYASHSTRNRRAQLGLSLFTVAFALQLAVPHSAAITRNKARFDLSMEQARTQKGAAVISYAELKTKRLPRRTRKLLKRAIKLDGNRLTEDALALVERALGSAPNFVEAHTAAAIANLKLNRMAEAYRHLQQALKIDPALLPAREVQGILFYREQNYQAAREVLEDVIRRAPGRALSHHFLSEVLYELDDPELALQHQEKAERLHRHPFHPRREPSTFDRDVDGAGWAR